MSTPVSTNPYTKLYQTNAYAGAAIDRSLFFFEEHPASFALAFLSPDLDFAATAQRLAVFAGKTPLIALSTAGELYEDAQSSMGFYLPANKGRRSLVIQTFSPDLIEKVSLHTVSLHKEDIRSGALLLNRDKRIARIKASLDSVTPPFPINFRDTVALTFIDGLSGCESLFMKAVYQSSHFPCLFIGGSAAGDPDCKHTYIFDGTTVREGYAVIAFLKMAPGKRYAAFKTQNYRPTHKSFITLVADPVERTVSTVVDSESLEILPIQTALARMIGFTIEDPVADLSNHALGSITDNEILIRSIARFGPEAEVVSFFSDISPGDRLYLLEKTDFAETTKRDYESFLKGKSYPVAGILTDCVSRRINNKSNLNDLIRLWKCPVSGFSSFGELFGVNINNSLLGLFFFEESETNQFSDPFLEMFPVQYGKFGSYFISRRLERVEALNRLRTATASSFIDYLAQIENGPEEVRAIAIQARMEKALRTSQQRLEVITSSLFDAVLLINGMGHIVFANPAARHLLGLNDTEEPRDLDTLVKLVIQGKPLPFTQAALEQAVIQHGAFTNDDAVFELAGGHKIEVAYAVSLIREDRDIEGVVISFRSIEALKIAQKKAMQSSRMASVGQLAAGIAHEINTPIQYIGDNLRFIATSFSDIKSIFEEFNSILDAETVSPEDLQVLRNVLKHYDITYLLDELPSATTQSIEGAERVAQIVRSLKEFSHPGNTAKSFSDINRAIESTSIVSRNEWKQVAALDLDLDPHLPEIECFAADINQVILNLIVNAAQAIESARRDESEMGRIIVSTRRNNGDIEIRVADNGPGVPPEIRARIFDPFFTTKEVGKGTGQGLSICFDTVVHKHGGALYLDESVSPGATFVVRLPIKGRESAKKG